MRKGVDIYRAWRDGEYYEGLSPEERALVPAGALGAVEISAEEMRAASGLATAATAQSWCFNSECLTHCICAC